MRETMRMSTFDTCCRLFVLLFLVSLSSLCTAQSLNSRNIPMPWYRYQLWSKLDAKTLAHATALSYDETSWNYVEYNDIESYSYYSIENAENYTELILAIDGIGFTEQVWDCWINHYSDYTWAELADVGVQSYLLTLGWSEANWGSPDLTLYPDTESLYFDQLTPAKQAALIELCYTREIWNGVSLELWPSLPEKGVLAPPSPTVATLRTASPTSTPTLSAMPTVFTTASPTASPTTPAPTTSYAPSMVPTAPTTLPPSPPIPSIDTIRFVTWENLARDVISNFCHNMLNFVT